MKARPIRKKAPALLLITMLAFLSACKGNDSGSGSVVPPGRSADDGRKTVTVGVTYAPSGLNPLAPAGLVSSYIDGLMFPPLVELGSDFKYKPMLADSIATADNQTFTIKLNPKAQWTDGNPVTADDVMFTLNLLANPRAASGNAYKFAMIEGLDDSGFLPDGKKTIDGVKKMDERTLTIKTKTPTPLAIFEDAIGRNLMTLPRAPLQGIPPEDINASRFMRQPTVTSGPFKIADIEADDSVRMEANERYFRGAPKIDRLIFKVLQGPSLFSELQSGGIDMNIPSAGVIPVEDYDKVKSLKNVVTMASPPTSAPFMYINERDVPDAKQRQAISYAINREQIVGKLLKGAGEPIDGFFTSYSPYRDESLKPVRYDPIRAKRLLKESGWDPGRTLTLSVLSGDSTLEQASKIIAGNLKAVGISIRVEMTDLATLLDKLAKRDYDLGILTGSLEPINPLPDMKYNLQTGNPNGYENPETEKLLSDLASEVDETKIEDDYDRLQQIVARDVPMTSIYAPKALGAVNKRVTGATPSDFGMFVNVNEWDVLPR